MGRMGVVRWAVLVLAVAVMVGGASPADARPGQPDDMTCAQQSNAGLLTSEEYEACLRREACEEFADYADVRELCDAFADFPHFDDPVEALGHCVDMDTLEVFGRCQVPEWQSTTVLNAFHRNHDYACSDEELEWYQNGTRAEAWYRLGGDDDGSGIDIGGKGSGLNKGFPGVYEAVCLDGPDPDAWKPEHVAAIAVIMTMEKHLSPYHDGKEESVCHSWDPQNVLSHMDWAQQEGGLIRVPLNTICDTLYHLGWPAYPARDEVVVHPGCDNVADRPQSEEGTNALDGGGWRQEGNDPGAAFLKDFLPERCWGRYPATNYDIGYKAPEFGDADLAAWMWGNSTAFAYNIGKGAVTLSLWAVDWAFVGFDIRDYDDAVGGTGAQRFAGWLIYHPSFPFVELAWLVLFAWAGYTALRRRMGVAGGEILMSIVLVGLSAVLLDNQRDYMDSTWGLMDRASTALLAAGQGEDPVDYEDADPETARRNRQLLVDGLNGGIFEAFVELPYDRLNWGESLTGACAERRNWIVARGPWGTKDGPRDAMGEADGCEHLVAFNEEPNGERLLGAVLVMLASLVLAVLLALVALTVVVAKLLAVVIFVLTPFAALVAILPGHGRRLAWAWVTGLIQVVIAVVGMSFLLAFLLLVTDGLLEWTEGVNLIERFFVLNLMVFIVFFARKRLLASSQSFAGRLGDYWSATRGSGAAWAGAGPGAGIDLIAGERAAKVAAVTAGLATAIPVGLAGRSWAIRWRERRQVYKKQFKMGTRVMRWKYGLFGVP
jgi:hypothetical protein